MSEDDTPMNNDDVTMVPNPTPTSTPTTEPTPTPPSELQSPLQSPSASASASPEKHMQEEQQEEEQIAGGMAEDDNGEPSNDEDGLELQNANAGKDDLDKIPPNDASNDTSNGADANANDDNDAIPEKDNPLNNQSEDVKDEEMQEMEVDIGVKAKKTNASPDDGNDVVDNAPTASEETIGGNDDAEGEANDDTILEETKEDHAEEEEAEEEVADAKETVDAKDGNESDKGGDELAPDDDAASKGESKVEKKEDSESKTKTEGEEDPASSTEGAPEPEPESVAENDVDMENARSPETETKRNEETSPPDPNAEDESPKSTTPPPKKRTYSSSKKQSSSVSKRRRKMTNGKKSEIPQGRGMRLSEIPSIRANIMVEGDQEHVLREMHKLLFRGSGGVVIRRGMIKIQLIRSHLLEFSGFLPSLEEGNEEEEAQEHKIEKNMGAKLRKFGIPLIKSFLDLLNLNRRPPTGKLPTRGFLSGLLLDFLASPNANDINLLNKGDNSASTLEKREEFEDKDDKNRDDDNSNSNSNSTGDDKMPSEEQLQEWVQAYVKCFSMDKATAKHALETASDKFEVNLVSKRPMIMKMLKEEVQKSKI